MNLVVYLNNNYLLALLAITSALYFKTHLANTTTMIFHRAEVNIWPNLGPLVGRLTL